MRRLHLRWTIPAAAAALLAGTVAHASTPLVASQTGTTGRGVPAGGPPVLYDAAPNVPELSNHDPRFRAPYDLVSGTEEYSAGEYLYTDTLYDDTNATYPSDFARYGGNAGDLAEYRMSVRGGDLAVRFSYTTLLVPDSTISVVAFDTDRNAATGSSALPRDPGMPFPGTDAVLTSWGTGATWSTWTGSAWKTTKLASKADVAANQVTVTVPRAVARPTGKWTATLATGLYDRTTGGWLSLGTGNSKIINLGFKLAPPVPNTDPSSTQMTALTTLKPTTFQHVLDFGLLRSGGHQDTIPKTGLMYRIFATRLTAQKYYTEPTPGVYKAVTAHEGRVSPPTGVQYLSRLQPYAVYVPTTYRASKPAPLTFMLHGQDDNYWGVRANVVTQRGEKRGSIVLAVAGRGQRGWYEDESEYDVFEAWNDVARHYTLDPRRTSITGYSMGGYGTYRISLRYPQLFSRVVVDAPAVMLFREPNGGNSGIWVPGVNDNPTLTNLIIANARNVPIFHIADVASEATFYPTVLQQVSGPNINGTQSLESLGYRYRLWSVAEDHIVATVADNFPEVTTWLGQHTVDADPFHVTFTRVPAMDRPDLGLVSDHAYWVSHVTLRDTKASSRPMTVGAGSSVPASGTVDVESLGFGETDPGSSLQRGAGVTSDGLPYVSQERTWGSAQRPQVQDRLVIRASNVRAVTIDPAAAHVSCAARLDITSDGPLTVHLTGCPTRHS